MKNPDTFDVSTIFKINAIKPTEKIVEKVVENILLNKQLLPQKVKDSLKDPRRGLRVVPLEKCGCC
jgi:hypothetical protein